MKKWLTINSIGLGSFLISLLIDQGVYVICSFYLIALASFFLLIISVISFFKNSKTQGIMLFVLTLILSSIEFLICYYWIISSTASVGDW